MAHLADFFTMEKAKGFSGKYNIVLSFPMSLIVIDMERWVVYNLAYNLLPHQQRTGGSFENQ